LLHTNELPLKKLFSHLDGPTSGPKGYTGDIGKQLPNCEKQTIADRFLPIHAELPEIDFSDLSTDQKYLYEISHAISDGHISADLANRNPGTLSNARFLTLANRILRLYASSNTPTETLRTLATYVIKVYAKSWFLIKSRPLCKDAARNFWEIIQSTRYLPQELKAIVDPVLQNNAFSLHPENLVLSMITDERPVVRELGLRKILKGRNRASAVCNQVRRFQVPKINFGAKEYFEVIDWNEVSDPPILRHFSFEDLVEKVRSKDNFIERFPSHTQSVERCVKMVTEAAAYVCGEDNRDKAIRAKLFGRKINPKFETKSDYNVSTIAEN